MNSILEEFQTADWQTLLPIMIPFMLVSSILILISFIDMYINRKERGNKIIWGIIILCIHILGPVLYLTLGRKVGG